VAHICNELQVVLMGRACTKLEYFFQGGQVPDNYAEVLQS
jgi:hypothetical protein